MTAAPSPHKAEDWDRVGEFGRAGTGLSWGISLLVMAGLFTEAAWIAIHWTPEVGPPQHRRQRQ